MKMKTLLAALPVLFLVFAVAPYAGAATLGVEIAQNLCFAYYDGATYPILIDNRLYVQHTIRGTHTEVKQSGKDTITVTATFKKAANKTVGYCCMSMQSPSTTNYASSEVINNGLVLSTPKWGTDATGARCQ